MTFALNATDKQYLDALAGSSEPAFDAMFTRYYAGLLRYAKSLLPYPTDAAEDVVADLFVAVWTQRAQLAVQGSLASYLYAAVKHRSFDKLRQQRRTPIEAEHDLPLTQPEAAYLQPDQLLDYQELNQHLLQLIERLPERTRQVFQLHRDGGLTYEEIATLLALSINSVKTHMFRALRFLKSALSVSGVQ
ncbi:RNA polymerase sigma-70 factor [Hymenobacter segetis]|uniref:RNA polymerase sigma-70 factor n=1 Tax=Hymenobacter segetis TaxID=2025509 RepID=A0ABU9LWX0_9BACT